jgi:hypothetical protein
VFHTPGIYYRPNNLKSMTMLLGNTESRTVYHNFHLDNLNSNSLDYSHDLYQTYLRNNYFLPPNEKNYFVHMVNNTLPTQPSNEIGKGMMNIFPLDLVLHDFNKPAISLGKFDFSVLKNNYI